MSRPQVFVRRVDDAHMHQLMAMWLDYRAEAGGSGEAAHRAADEGTLTAVLRRPDVTAFIASIDDEGVGYLILSDTVGGLLTDSPCTAIDQLFVARPWRRHGVARQLLAAAAAHADLAGASAIVTNVPSQGRDANRFFARLGFSPMVVRRVTTPAALHRKLAAGSDSVLGLQQVLQRRRSARGRAVRQGTTAVREA